MQLFKAQPVVNNCCLLPEFEEAPDRQIVARISRNTRLLPTAA